MVLLEKLRFLYNSYVLAVLTIGYIAGEVGHYLIGITSKQTAIDIDYGDHACQQSNTLLRTAQLPMQCGDVMVPERYVSHSPSSCCNLELHALIETC